MRIYVAEDHLAPEVADDLGRRGERERGHEHLRARSDAERLGREVERRGAGVDRDRMRNADRLGEALLEFGC